MSEVRLIGIGRVKDYNATVDAVQSVAAIAAELDGVLKWEAFIDEASGTLVLTEEFASDAALAEYEKKVSQGGLRPVIGAAMDLEQLMVLSRIEDPSLNEALDDLGAIRATKIASK